MDCYSVSNSVFSSAVKKKLPINGSFEITADCNFNCKMCYIHNCKKRNLPVINADADKWCSLFDECEKSGLLYALLTGGEPLVHPQFDKIYTCLVGKNILPILNTNGYLIDESRAEFFKQLPPSRMNITLYGTSDGVYQKLCGVKNGFTKVDNALHILKKNKMNISVNLTIVKTNVGEVDNLVKYAKENDYKLRPTTYIFGTESNCIDERLSPEEAAKVSLELYRLTHTEDEYKLRIASSLVRIKAGDKACPKVFDQPGITCRAGTAAYWVHYDGKLNFCGMITDDNAPNVFEMPFEQAWQYAVREAAAVKNSVACTICKYRFFCKKCYAMLQSEGVKPEDVEQSYACKYNKAYADEIIKAGKKYGTL